MTSLLSAKTELFARWFRHNLKMVVETITTRFSRDTLTNPLFMLVYSGYYAELFFFSLFLVDGTISALYVCTLKNIFFQLPKAITWRSFAFSCGPARRKTSAP